MRVMDICTVADPGCHCAFTDVIRWNGRVYVTFREGLNHSLGPWGQIVVMASADGGRTYVQHARIARSGFDLRDPHFFTVEDRLCVTIPSWVIPSSAVGRERGIEKPVRACFVAQSTDGVGWDLREIDLLYDRTIWRPRRGPDGLWYAAAYCREPDGVGDVRLFKTRDGWTWEEVSVIHDDKRPNETELCFLDAGSLVALVRREEEPHTPVVARSMPPYDKWSKTESNLFLKGPLLERLPDGTMLVVGRSTEPLGSPPRGELRTRMFRLDLESAELEPLLTLPSGGDTSYAGLCHMPDGTALLSYYSGHLYANGSFRGGDEPQRTGVYVARLEL